MGSVIEASSVKDRIEIRRVRIRLQRILARDVTYTIAETWRFLRKAGVVMERRGYEIGKAEDTRTAFPSLSERAGRHVMRDVAVKWCRAHPVQAAELPSWDLDLLRRVLEGVA